MACRNNLKKEKRLRNRINAFRFKKPQSRNRRFDNNNNAQDQKNADADAKYYSMVRACAARNPWGVSPSAACAGSPPHPLRARAHVQVFSYSAEEEAAAAERAKESPPKPASA